MNLLKEKLNPNSEYNKKLRRDGIAMVEEMYKEAIECLEDCIKNQPCECRNEMQLAIEALEKQIPKKPKVVEADMDGMDMETGEEYTYKIDEAHCINCNSVIGNEYDRYDEQYCNKCGQKIDWSEWEY